MLLPNEIQHAVHADLDHADWVLLVGGGSLTASSAPDPPSPTGGNGEAIWIREVHESVSLHRDLSTQNCLAA